jgi:6-pyruvoyltetrahydropterin/6-carboxytetrahydropterin synthase
MEAVPSAAQTVGHFVKMKQTIKTKIFKEFKFSAAHCLRQEGHKCSEVHGHNYRVRIECSGDIGVNGMIEDFHEIKRRVQPIIDRLDHHMINDVIIQETTSENIANWIFKQANDQLGNVARVTLWETDSCGAIVER